MANLSKTVNNRTHPRCFPWAALIAAGALAAPFAALRAEPPVETGRIAYRETFPGFLNPEQFLRTAAAADGWEIIDEPGTGRFLRVTITPRAGRLRAIVVWDLAPVQFNRLSVRVRSEVPVFLSGALNDRLGNSFILKPYGEAGVEGGKRAPLPAGGVWNDYRVVLPGDLEKITGRGREISPFVHGQGDALADWEGIDFQDLGFKAIYFHVDVPARSPQLGRPFHVDFLFLELATEDPQMPALPLAEIPAGEFEMGRAAGSFDRDLSFNQVPVHTVRISQPFRMGVTGVTSEQFRQFRPEFQSTDESSPYATGVSWHDAMAFCEWLSQREGKPHRLPTEAEWEYAAHQAEKLGLQDMLSGPLEWCMDWFGDYPEEAQTDPIGPETGFARVVRGGCLDPTDDAKVYAHPSHRSGIAPGFGAHKGAPGDSGRHHIGFRLVQAPMPDTAPRAARIPFLQQGVRQNSEHVGQAPDPAKPYFRKRHLLPVPPDNAPTPAIDALALHPSFRKHNHSAALTVCPNGDLLMVTYTSYREYEPEVSLMATRLRFGAEDWDMPSPFVDFPAVNDHAPMLLTDGDTVRLFWGNPLLPGAFPFQWIESNDNGATWSEVRFPRFQNAPGPHSRQPINSGFRAPDGALHVASDGEGGTSVLWTSTDDGETWSDPGSRSAGRHTTYCLLADGGILGLGGKNTDIDGFMPAVVSRDGGLTWETGKSVFPALGGNQRPSVLRLQSGRLFFAGDFQDIEGKRPKGVTERGSFVALSEDDGRTWHIKKLIGTQPHEVKGALKGADTLGYSAAAQAPNGMIHLITSMNHPCLHFEFNEAWILAPETDDPGDAVLMKSAATEVDSVETWRENFPDGNPRIEGSGGVADDGRHLRHGNETWFHPDGKKHYSVNYHLGHKTGEETLWRSDGSVEWQWEHGEDGVSVWTQFHPDGGKRAQSHWRGKFAHGPAVLWDADGREFSRIEFSNGEAQGLPLGRSQRESGGAVEGAQCYVDRDYRIVSLPAELAGGDLVRTANEEDGSTGRNHLTLDLPDSATVHVCYWAEAHDLPEWLQEPEWQKMPGRVEVEILGSRKAYEIFARTFPKGRVVLGGNERGKTGAASMYFVVITPDSKSTSGSHRDANKTPTPHPG